MAKSPTVTAKNYWLSVKPCVLFRAPEITGPSASPIPILALNMPAATSLSSFESLYCGYLYSTPSRISGKMGTTIAENARPSRTSPNRVNRRETGIHNHGELPMTSIERAKRVKPAIMTARLETYRV